MKLFTIVIFISFLSAEIKAQFFHHNFPECICVPVYIITQPVVASAVCPNADVTLSVIAGGTGPHTYKWKENGVVLSDGNVYSGTNTSALTISNPGSVLDGKIYQCQVSNCGRFSVSTDPDILNIQTSDTDVNEDGITDNQDFTRLNLLYNSSCANCREDINSDGFIDVKDFLQLLGLFNTTCQ